MDQSGAKKNPDETWMARDGCNHCICSIFGPICTKSVLEDFSYGLAAGITVWFGSSIVL